MTTRVVHRLSAVALVALWLLPAMSAPAQVPWVVFEDSQSASTCDVINTANVELVLLASTGELVIVTGEDIILSDTYAEEDQYIYYLGLPFGTIEFAEDADGFRTLWWLSALGRIIEVDEFIGVPFETDLFPSDVSNVPCDACDFWDDPIVCEEVLLDSDGDGVPDIDDLCPDTPLSEIDDVDIDGCSCSEFDGDGDDVNDCYDLCPDTPLSAIDYVDVDGCACSDLDDDGDYVDNCDDLCPDTVPSEIDYVDIDGCACSDLDDDGDFVSNCDDVCPTTPLGADVDFDGCVISYVPPVTVNFCGSTGAATLAMMFAGVAGVRLLRRREI